MKTFLLLILFSASAIGQTFLRCPVFVAPVPVVESGGITEVTNGIVGWWKFSEGTGTTVADSSGGGFTGTLTSGATWSDGAGFFDGVNDHVAIVDNAAFSPQVGAGGELTLSGWVKIDTFPTTDQKRAPIVAKGTTSNYEWALYISGESSGGTNAAQMYVWTSIGAVVSGAASANNLIQTNSWYFLVGTFKQGVGAEIFVNGATEDTDTDSGASMANGTSPVNIGRRPDAAAGQFIDGLIDDVRIFNRVLTSGEISTLYSNGRQ